MSTAYLWLSSLMVRLILVLSMLVALGACAMFTESDAPTADDQVRPQSRPSSGVAPSATARTEAEFDTTTPEEKAAAQAVPDSASERALGTTVASLGSPSEPGFWLKTPLVQDEMPGRAVYPANGRSVQLTLIPIEGPVTAGSRMSLSALRLLEAPLTGLTEVQVYAGG